MSTEVHFWPNKRWMFLALMVPVFIMIAYFSTSKLADVKEYIMDSAVSNSSALQMKIREGNSVSIDAPRNTGKAAKFLIYSCESSCGGLGDRLRGIVNSFVLAVITGRTFGIHHHRPCKLDKFLKPNRYNWKIDKKLLENRSSKVYSVMDQLNLMSRNMTEYFKEDVVYFKSNTDITRALRMQVDVPRKAPWLTKWSTADVYRNVLSNLFVLDESLQGVLDKFRQKFVKNRRTVCAHFRSGKNPTMPNDVPRNVGQIDQLWKFLSSYDTNDNVFYVATDSKHIKSLAKSKFPSRFISISGKIVHTDRTQDDAGCSGFRFAILEHRFLSQCDVILLTESGYGRTAGFMRAHSNDMFCLQSTGILPCSRTTLPDVLPGYYSPKSWYKQKN